MSTSGIRRPIGILLVEEGEEDARRKRETANDPSRSRAFRPTIVALPLDDRVY